MKKSDLVIVHQICTYFLIHAREHMHTKARPLCCNHTVFISRSKITTLANPNPKMQGKNHSIPMKSGNFLSLNLKWIFTLEFAPLTKSQVILTELTFKGMEGWRVQDGGERCNSLDLPSTFIQPALLKWREKSSQCEYLSHYCPS